MKTTTKTTRAPRASKQSAAIANRASEQASAATDWRTSPEALSCIAATVAQPAAPVPPATSEVPALPVVTPGATHFRLTRKFIEVASDVRHYEADLAALGYRDGDKIEFGTLTAAGSFTTSTKALAASSGEHRGPRAKAQTAEMLAMMNGTMTAAQIAAAIVAKFGGAHDAVLASVRRLPFHAKKAGKLGADVVPFAKAVSDKAAAKAAAAAARAAMEYGV